MDQAVRLLAWLLAGGLGVTAATTAAVWWMEPTRRVVRALTRTLGGAADALLVSPVRGQGAALGLDEDKIALIRGRGDAGVLFDLEELQGVELVFDDEVRARAFRGEGRRPLDHLAPEVEQVMLRLVFADVRNPEFELELWRASDPLRPGQDGRAAVQAARKWFARLEAIVRR